MCKPTNMLSHAVHAPGNSTKLDLSVLAPLPLPPPCHLYMHACKADTCAAAPTQTVRPRGGSLTFMRCVWWQSVEGGPIFIFSGDTN